MRVVLEDAEKDLAVAFNAWKQELIDTPEKFGDVKKYGSSYGERCANKLLTLLKVKEN